MIRTTSGTLGVLHRGLCPLLATPLESVTPEVVIRYIFIMGCNSNGEELLPQALSRRMFEHPEHKKNNEPPTVIRYFYGTPEMI